MMFAIMRVYSPWLTAMLQFFQPGCQSAPASAAQGAALSKTPSVSASCLRQDRPTVADRPPLQPPAYTPAAAPIWPWVAVNKDLPGRQNAGGKEGLFGGVPSRAHISCMSQAHNRGLRGARLLIIFAYVVLGLATDLRKVLKPLLQLPT